MLLSVYEYECGRKYELNISGPAVLREINMTIVAGDDDMAQPFV
jgi:hypothetical protein